MTSKTLGWKFNYKLTNKIDCNFEIQDRCNINFITEIYGKSSQRAIIGFNITSKNTIQEDAENNSNQKASRLIQLLVASSGTHSTFFMTGYEEITESGGGRIGSNCQSSYSIRHNAILSMGDELFQEILENNTELINKIYFISMARRAEKSNDFKSIINYLFQACNEEPQNDLKKFTALRNAISHNKKPLHKSTISGLAEGFGENYFQLTDDNKFDFESEQNIQNLKIQSSLFLKTMHEELRQKLESL